MRHRLRRRAAIAALIVAGLTATWIAVLPQTPVPREVLLGGGLGLFTIIGGLAIIETVALRRAGERMRRFLADASHELRTPISGIQASAETLIRTRPGHAAREELVLRILREAHGPGGWSTTCSPSPASNRASPWPVNRSTSCPWPRPRPNRHASSRPP